jgi:hypothetical protein
MFVQGVFRSRILVGGLIAAVLLLFMPVAEFAQAKSAAPASGGSLVGFIFAKDMKTPVANAIVKIRDVSTTKEYESQPTDANGMYRITGIQEGRYILGVTTAAGNFNFDYVMLIKSGDMAKLSVALQEGGQTTGQDAKSKSFFKEHWLGIATLVVVVGHFMYDLLKKEKEESPIR